jgi:hypothetical protein
MNKKFSSCVVNLSIDLISNWHNDDNAKKIVFNEFDDEKLFAVVSDLINTNIEMWHEEDKVRSEDDTIVLKAIRNINPLNQRRNDDIEKIDEIMG